MANDRGDGTGTGRRPRKGIRIGELARRAGVTRSTIQHYVREGLLPRPFKTHRNMAYYAPELVERVRLIRRLQERHRLPLRRIRELLRDPERLAALEAAVTVTETEPVPRSVLLHETGLSPEALDRLIGLGLVRTRRDEDGEVWLDPVDAEVVRAVAALQATGLGPEQGLYAEDLKLYQDLVEQLVAAEAERFLAALGSGRLDRPLEAVVGAALAATERLIVALRRRLLAELLHDPSRMRPRSEGGGA